jgi:hypothetical protein
MNERIRDFGKQAYDAATEIWPINSKAWYEVYNTTFAELIVGECITQCSKALVEHTGQPSVTHNYAVGLCQDNIKEHFGVGGMSTEDKKTLIKELLGVKKDD